MAIYSVSKFHMWRGCIAAAWIDGNVASDELDWANEKISQLAFTEAQKLVLLRDLNNAVDFNEISQKVTDSKDRAFLCHQIEEISKLDKEYSDTEKALFTKWIGIINNDKNTEIASISEREIQSYHEDDVLSIVNKHTLFQGFANSILRMMEK